MMTTTRSFVCRIRFSDGREIRKTVSTRLYAKVPLGATSHRVNGELHLDGRARRFAVDLPVHGSEPIVDLTPALRSPLKITDGRTATIGGRKARRVTAKPSNPVPHHLEVYVQGERQLEGRPAAGIQRIYPVGELL